VWRRQRLLWWVYGVSLALAYFAIQPLAATVAPILNRSLAADRLYHHFDLATLFELLSRPEFTRRALTRSPVFFGVVFLALMLLFTGGILKAYNEDRTLTTAEFLGSGGGYFWRFFRLLIFMLIALAPVRLLHWGFRAWSNTLADRWAQPAPSVFVRIAGILTVLFLLIVLRLWFDLAEVQAVAEDEYAMHRVLMVAARLTRRNLGALLWIYLAPGILAGTGTALALAAWVRLVPHEAVNASLVLSQAVILLWTLARLWQRSSEVLWYQQRPPGVLEEPSSLPEFSLEAPPPPEVPPAEVSL